MRLIYADEFVARLHAHGVGVDPETRETLISVADIQRILLEVPTVEPKRGRWVKNGPPVGITRYKCSVCGSGMGISFQYCPNCGAHMQEGSETDG